MNESPWGAALAGLSEAERERGVAIIQRAIGRYLTAPDGSAIVSNREDAALARLAHKTQCEDVSFVLQLLAECQRRRATEADSGWAGLPDHAQERMVELFANFLASQMHPGDRQPALTSEEYLEVAIIAAAAGSIPASVGAAVTARYLAWRCTGCAARLSQHADGWCRLNPVQQRRALDLLEKASPHAVFSPTTFLRDLERVWTKDEAEEWWSLVRVAGRMPDWLSDLVLSCAAARQAPGTGHA